MSSTDVDLIAVLRSCARSSIVAAAGCGKTRAIAACLRDADQPHLVLTHTHAGVHAIRSRLRVLGVDSVRHSVSTLAGFAIRYASAYPGLAGRRLAPVPRSKAEWGAYYSGAAAVVRARTGKALLRRSYAALLVDEYQDCGSEQHELVRAVAESLPTCVLGDPLQAIFDLDGKPIDWEAVEREFTPAAALAVPHRWASTRPELGAWLSEARRQLVEEGQVAIDAEAPVTWIRLGEPAFRAQHDRIRADMSEPSSTMVVVTGNLPQIARSWAKRVPLLSVVESAEGRDLLLLASKLDVGSSSDKAKALTRFAGGAATGMGPARKFVARLGATQRRVHRREQPFRAALRELAEVGTPRAALDALTSLRAVSGVRVFRRELWDELERALRMVLSGEADSVVDAVEAMRNRARHKGRHINRRAVGSTLLVKGLEFDHVLVIDADGLSKEGLYVAMTRARRTLTVMSRSRVIRPNGGASG